MNIVLFFYVVAFISVVGHAVVAYYITEHRFSTKKTIAIWTGFVFLALGLSLSMNHFMDIENKGSFGYYRSLFLYIVTYYVASTGNVGKRTFLLLTYATCYSMFIGLYSIIRLPVFGLSAGGMTLLLWVTMLVATITFFLKVLFPIIDSAGKYIGKKWLPLCVVAGLFLCALLTLSITPNVTRDMSTRDVVVYISFVLLICAIYPILFGYLRAMAQISQDKQIKLQNNLLLSYVENQRLQAEFTRRLQHDLRHHNFVTAEFARAADNEGLLRYLEQRQAQIDSFVEMKMCDNETLNHILRVFKARGDKAHIRMEILAQARKNLSISDVDMVSLVANMMENAIKGSRESGVAAPYVHVEIYEKAGKLVITCQNSCTRDLVFKEMLPDTIAGTGVASILHVVGRYDGAVDFSAKDGRFICTVLLNCEQTSPAQGSTLEAQKWQGCWQKSAGLMLGE